MQDAGVRAELKDCPSVALPLAQDPCGKILYLIADPSVHLRVGERERMNAADRTVRLQKVKLPCRTCLLNIADGSHLKDNFCLSALVCVRIPSASGIKPDSH